LAKSNARKRNQRKPTGETKHFAPRKLAQEEDLARKTAQVSRTLPLVKGWKTALALAKSAIRSRPSVRVGMFPLPPKGISL
jgi:hypothetical protein